MVVQEFLKDKFDNFFCPPIFPLTRDSLAPWRGPDAEIHGRMEKMTNKTQTNFSMKMGSSQMWFFHEGEGWKMKRFSGFLWESLLLKVS